MIRNEPARVTSADIIPEDWLDETPYLVPNDLLSRVRFHRSIERSFHTRDRARDVARRIRQDVEDVLEPFQLAIRSDLVAESNRIEGLEWTPDEVREVVRTHRELLSPLVHNVMEALRGDDRVIEALGLYKAHLLAEQWALEDRRPREFEIRSLHAIINVGETHAGAYKSKENVIGGSSHRPVPSVDVPRAMEELTRWWLRGTPDPVLDATVIHAWLTHIHPFEDGNGRVARLLANFALVQAEYPPLLISSASDRGQYYDALAESDEGNILPLYDLISHVLRRTAKTMARRDYVRDVVANRLLSDSAQRHSTWKLLAKTFASELESMLPPGWHIELQGYPDLTSFFLLSERSGEGASWFIKVIDSSSVAKWLLSFNINSSRLMTLLGTPTGFPSIFISERDFAGPTGQSFQPVITSIESELPSEIVLVPGEVNPTILRRDEEISRCDLRSGVALLVEGMTA